MKISDLKLPKKFKTKELNKSTLKQVLGVYEDKLHLGLNKVKTRSEINRTKKKWYKQKGTGGARHGARSAHVFVGGGVAHGPTGVKRIKKLTKNIKKLATNYAISLKEKEKNLVLVSALEKVKKTAEISKFIKNLNTGNKKILFAISEKNKDSVKFIRNLRNVNVMTFENLNAYQIIKHGMLIIDETVFKKEKIK
jgi:large subunit ribosomal protein L4